MKCIIALQIISSFLAGCTTTLNLDKINNEFVKKEKPISGWDIDLLNTRTKAFGRLHLNFESIHDLYLIEEYNIEGCYYSGLVYLDEYHFFHFSRQAVGADLMMSDKSLSNTERFMITELNKGRYGNIRKKSKSTDVMSPSSLYITTFKTSLWNKVRFYSFKEFCIE